MARFKYNIFIAIAALFLIGSGIYIICNRNAHASEDEHTDLMLWYIKGDDLHDGFADIAKQFNNNNETIGRMDIDVSTRGFASFEKLQEALAAADDEESPDMISCSVNQAALLDSLGYIVNCSNYIEEWNAEEFHTDFIECATANKRLIAVPYAADVELMIVNKDVFPEAYKVNSIETLCEQSKNYYSQHGKALFTIGDYAQFFKIAMAQLGEDFNAVNPRYSGSANCKKIYSLIAQTAYDRGFVSCDDPVSAVIRGDVACAIVSASDIMENAGKFNRNIKIYECPRMEKGKQIYSLEVEGICVCNTDSVTQNACAEFIKWFTYKEINHAFVSDTGYIPAIGDMSAISSGYSVYNQVKQVVGNLNTKYEHVDYPPNADYAKNYSEFAYTMQLVMDSLS